MQARETVLLVDDEPQVLVALEDVLSEEYEIVKAGSAARALEIVAHRPEIAVVLTDQRMPHMTGDELLARLAITTNMAHILVTGFAEPSAVIRAVNDGGIFAYVAKPWNDDDLRLKVRRAVQHVRLARELMEERRLLQGLMDSVSDGIYFKDAALRFVRANRAFARSLGVAVPENLVGKSLKEIVPGAESEAAEREEALVLGGDEAAEDALRRAGSSEKSRWFSEIRARLLNQSGEVVGIVGIARDVTERVRGDEALRQGEARYREQTALLNSILAGIGEGVVVLDRSGHVVLFNRRAEKILGIGPPEVEPVGLAEAYGIYGRDQAPLASEENPLLRAMAGEERTEAEVFVKNARVSGANVAVTATPLRDDYGNLRGSIALLHDVTAQRQLEKKLSQSQKLEAIGRLAASVAHDFNNLLSVILSYSSLALNELPADASVRADVEAIRGAGERAAELTRQLLAFGRAQVPSVRVVDVNAIVRDSAKLLQRLLGDGIELRVHSQGSWCVRADPRQIEQVVMNLAVNARDAMPEGGELLIATSNCELSAAPRDEWPHAEPGRYVMLTVSDTGVGMDSATIARIFEPFFTTKEFGKGTGLGLATVESIVKQSHGHLRVDSALGKGTRFGIILPATEEAASSVNTLGPPMKLEGSETILLVEQQEEVRRAAAQVLRRRGYRVFEARGAREALILCESSPEPIDLLLTDVASPPSGHQLPARLRALQPALRVLLMSGQMDAAATQPRGGDGAQEYFLQKPFSAEGLLRRVREVFDDTLRHALN
ncbi:MAG TPA: response regulator [Polyangiaceae bacterium]|nr:response regulator [Polyangiaceae bacterium]